MNLKSCRRKRRKNSTSTLLTQITTRHLSPNHFRLQRRIRWFIIFEFSEESPFYGCWDWIRLGKMSPRILAKALDVKLGTFSRALQPLESFRPTYLLLISIRVKDGFDNTSGLVVLVTVAKFFNPGEKKSSWSFQLLRIDTASRATMNINDGRPHYFRRPFSERTLSTVVT